MSNVMYGAMYISAEVLCTLHIECIAIRVFLPYTQHQEKGLQTYGVLFDKV